MPLYYICVSTLLHHIQLHIDALLCNFMRSIVLINLKNHRRLLELSAAHISEKKELSDGWDIEMKFLSFICGVSSCLMYSDDRERKGKKEGKLMGELNYTMKRKKREHSSAAPKHNIKSVSERRRKKNEKRKKEAKGKSDTRQQRDMKLVFAVFSIG